jgi:CRISPR-associated protein Cas2
MYIIAVYDINTETREGRRALNRIFKVMKKYLIHIQKSVFEGELTNAQFQKMKLEVMQIIDPACDSVIYFSSRESRWLDKEVHGLGEKATDNFI